MSKKPGRRMSCEFYNWNLFERNGVYYADGRCNSPTTGKHSLGTRDHKEAMEKLRQLDRTIAIQRKIAAPLTSTVQSGLTISEGWERFATYCARPQPLGGTMVATQKRYRAVKNKHQEFCAANRTLHWDQVDKQSVESYGRWLAQKDYADASVYMECMVIIQILRWLIDEERILPESRRVRLKMMRSQESHTYCYTPVQVVAMLEQSRKENLSWLGTIIVFLATTGMRIGELLQLQWTDIDLENGIITLRDDRHNTRSRSLGTVRTTKGGRSRRIPIHRTLLASIDKLSKHPSGRVIVGPAGGKVKADDIRIALIKRILKPLKEKFLAPTGVTGFEHGRLHSFRHYFVSQSFLGGASEGEIREWVGHRESRMLERYRHLSNDEARRKMDRICFLRVMPNHEKNNTADRPAA